MKILILHNSYQQRGGEDQVFELEIFLLREHGIEVAVYTISNHEIKGYYSKLITALNLPYSFSWKKKIGKKIDSFKPDIVHVHNFFPILTPSVFYECKSRGVPVIHTLHNYRLICPTATLMYKGKVYEDSIHKSAFTTVSKRVYQESWLGTFCIAVMIELHKKIGTWNNKVDGFVALTNFAKQKFISAGFPESKIYVKPNFVADPFANIPIPTERQGFGLFVGRLSEEKGIEVLIKACENIKFPIKIVGDGPLRDKLVKQNKYDFVSFLGNQSNSVVSALMTHANFLIMPSIWYEGFPMVLVEAMAHGLPVICSNLGAMQEIIQNEKTGLHFQSGDHEELAQEMNRLIEDEDLSKKLGVNARLNYLSLYTPEKNFNILLDIYKKVEKYDK